VRRRGGLRGELGCGTSRKGASVFYERDKAVGGLDIWG